MKYLKLQMDCYPQTLHILSGKSWDLDKANKLLGHDLGEENRHIHSQARCFGREGHQVIWVSGTKEQRRSSQGVSLLAHELVHAAIYAAEYLGFDDPVACSEFHCYFVQWGLLRAMDNGLVG